MKVDDAREKHQPHSKMLIRKQTQGKGIKVLTPKQMLKIHQ